MGGRRYTKEDLKPVEALIEEGLTSKDIAQKLGRSEAGIRNLRYRQGLRDKAENETKTLFSQRDDLRTQVHDLTTQISQLQEKQSELPKSIGSLEKQKEKAETILKLDKIILQSTLTEVLTRLRAERPELFILNQQEQGLYLVQLLIKNIFG